MRYDANLGFFMLDGTPGYVTQILPPEDDNLLSAIALFATTWERTRDNDDLTFLHNIPFQNIKFHLNRRT